MEHRKPNEVTISEGLAFVRHRIPFWLGNTDPHRPFAMRLLANTLDWIAKDNPRPRDLRVRLHSDGVLIGYDGAPLSIKSIGHGVQHPALYDDFMELKTGDHIPFWPILNALSERLVVSTMHDAQRYRAVFARGTIVSLLAQTRCDRPLGATWLVYSADPEVITGGSLTMKQAAQVCTEVEDATGVTIVVADRSSQEADWY